MCYSTKTQIFSRTKHSPSLLDKFVRYLLFENEEICFDVECSYKFNYLNEMNLHTRIAGHLFRRYFYGKIFRKMSIPR